MRHAMCRRFLGALSNVHGYQPGLRNYRWVAGVLCRAVGRRQRYTGDQDVLEWNPYQVRSYMHMLDLRRRKIIGRVPYRVRLGWIHPFHEHTQHKYSSRT